MKINNVKVRFVCGDITELKSDAIVNPANTELKMGGGLALAIKRKGGGSIEKEAVSFAPIGLGESIITSAGELAAEYVIHTATMAMNFKTDQHIIRKAMDSLLDLARVKELKIIGIPALGCGVGRFLVKEAAWIMAEETINHIHQGTVLKELIFVLHTPGDYKIFEHSFISHAGYILRKLSKVPIPTVDAIIELDKDRIFLIERKNPPFGWALPGGFLESNESLEDCLIREVREETSLEVTELEQFHTYSEPGRDPRFQTVSTVFIVKAKGAPSAQSDAKSLEAFDIKKLPLREEFAFDHWQIIQDWLKKFHK